MRFSNMIMAIDVHTAGEPARVLVGGIPYIPGDTIVDKKIYFMDNLDHVRRALMLEPRGHRDMYGIILTEPTRNDCDVGVVFMDSGGYLDMCVHGSIGVVKVVLGIGLVKLREPITVVKLDTPAGKIVAEAKVDRGIVKCITIRNVPSFLYQPDVKIEVPGVDSVNVDIAFGGNFYAIVNATRLRVKVETQYVRKLVDLGLTIRNIINRKIKAEHPWKKHISGINLVQICDSPKNPNATYRNAVIFGAGQLDRSPCGTGTCAKMAALHAKGLLKIHEQVISESIMGTLFKGQIIGKTKVGDFKAIIPEVTGEAYITGIHQFIIDPEDPLKNGFLI